MATVLLARRPLTGPLSEDEGGKNQEKESGTELRKDWNLPSEAARLVASARKREK